MDRIPLFPLEVVLFPGNPLPLRVFEPRYHAMLHDCARSGQDFGVVLLQAGQEVGGPAEPREVGTLAHIEQRSDQGEVTYLLTRGTRRFRIGRTFREKPYLEGEVAWLPEPTEDAPHVEGLAHDHGEPGHGHAHFPVQLEVAALFEEYLTLLARLTNVPLDDEIRELLGGQRRAGGWAMACAIGGALLVSPEEKQPILEVADVHDALHLEHALLQRECARLRVLQRSSGARLN
jgi:Lon protease-like protein